MSTQHPAIMIAKANAILLNVRKTESSVKKKKLNKYVYKQFVDTHLLSIRGGFMLITRIGFRIAPIKSWFGIMIKSKLLAFSEA